MNRYHKTILEQIKQESAKIAKQSSSESYIQSGHIYYSVNVPKRRLLVKQFTKDYKNLSIKDFIDLLNSFALGESHEEKSMVGMFLEYYPKLRSQLTPQLVDEWLDDMQGWAEVDSICQNKFTYKEMLSEWPSWTKLLNKLSEDRNVNKRRASIVLLTGPVSYSDDNRLADMAFENIDRLKREKDILITKAISWLLRSMIYTHPNQVERYIEENASTLPAIAVRETQRKLATGKK